MIGEIFSRLTVIAEGSPCRSKSGHLKYRRYVCLCECGNKVLVSKHKLQIGNTKSCGCLKRDKNNLASQIKEQKRIEVERRKILRSQKKISAKQRYWSDPLFREQQLQKNRVWTKSNMPKALAKKARRRARQFNATPKWLTLLHHQQILEMYLLAKELERITSVKYHVDHIVPLTGKDVCGLHVPWNLQVIPAVDNMRKGNRININE